MMLDVRILPKGAYIRGSWETMSQRIGNVVHNIEKNCLDIVGSKMRRAWRHTDIYVRFLPVIRAISCFQRRPFHPSGTTPYASPMPSGMTAYSMWAEEYQS